VVDVSNSFEVRHEVDGSGATVLDEAFLSKKLEQCTPARLYTAAHLRSEAAHC
jgi:hypothetical protein